MSVPKWACLRWLGVILLTLQLSSCVTRSDPEASGGRLLSGTSDISSVEPAIRISPDGVWLLLQELGSTPIEPRFAFYDLGASKAKTISLSLEATETLSAGATALTWLADWRPSGLTATLPIGTAGRVIEATPTAARPSWVNSISLQVLASSPRYDSENQRRFRTVGQGSSRVAILDNQDGDRVIVYHEGFFQRNLTIERIVVSNDGNAIGYTLSAGRGFTGPTRGFVTCVARGSRPRLLAAPIAGGIAWSPVRDQVYAAARGNNGNWGIYSWEISPCR